MLAARSGARVRAREKLKIALLTLFPKVFRLGFYPMWSENRF